MKDIPFWSMSDTEKKHRLASMVNVMTDNERCDVLFHIYTLMDYDKLSSRAKQAVLMDDKKALQ